MALGGGANGWAVAPMALGGGATANGAGANCYMAPIGCALWRQLGVRYGANSRVRYGAN